MVKVHDSPRYCDKYELQKMPLIESGRLWSKVLNFKSGDLPFAFFAISRRENIAFL